MEYGIYGKKAIIHSSSLDLWGNGEVTQTIIYNYRKEGTRTKSLSDTGALRFVTPLSHFLPAKSDTQSKNIFPRFCSYGRETLYEPLPAIFSWWDVSCFFKHRLQNKSHVVSSSAEGNYCGLAGKDASDYGMNVPVKHATLRCYGPGRALIRLLIMPFGAVDSQRTYHGDAHDQFSPLQ